jgi:hypothetical protein
MIILSTKDCICFHGTKIFTRGFQQNTLLESQDSVRIDNLYFTFNFNIVISSVLQKPDKWCYRGAADLYSEYTVFQSRQGYGPSDFHIFVLVPAVYRSKLGIAPFSRPIQPILQTLSTHST